MRLKHVKGAEEAIENSGFVVQDPENMRGRWRRGSRPFAVEIGMGKGSFITGMAAKMFVVAGPVIVFGTLASVIYGIILMLVQYF